jgi:glutamate dehydrogenase (NAD(P)+)
MIAVREAFKDLGITPAKTRASVQGFGNVAQHAVELFQRMGGTITCVSCWDHVDRISYTYRKNGGIILDELLPIANPFGEIDKHKAVEKGYECLPGDAWIEQDVDLLVPAALENQITAQNVGKIRERVKIIVEGANGPTTPDSDSILNERGILNIPDLLANAGGFICSYFEQVQGNMNTTGAGTRCSASWRSMTDAYLAVSSMRKKQPAKATAYDRRIADARLPDEAGWNNVSTQICRFQS